MRPLNALVSFVCTATALVSCHAQALVLGGCSVGLDAWSPCANYERLNVNPGDLCPSTDFFGNVLSSTSTFVNNATSLVNVFVSQPIPNPNDASTLNDLTLYAYTTWDLTGVPNLLPPVAILGSQPCAPLTNVLGSAPTARLYATGVSGSLVGATWQVVPATLNFNVEYTRPYAFAVPPPPPPEDYAPAPAPTPAPAPKHQRNLTFLIIVTVSVVVAVLAVAGGVLWVVTR